ncbi:uncharacterized protein LOC116287922 [Actinia tenebrosa]|uniref:Uncharacterized protein LOC116287922 n=1 Tax=Actinia tenebrosa TaxID=6105 RepID=A0A6P8HD67_ACTTE|nr:uncharacterized protein LOC116287922 [Actinia tenebrosa]
MPRFNVGRLMKRRKQIKEAERKRKILNDELEVKSKKIRAKDAKLRRLNEKVDSLVQEIEEVDDIRVELRNEEEKADFLPSRAVNARKKKETGQRLKPTTSRKRRRETLGAAKEIHEGEKGARYGLVDTVDKAVKAEEAVKIIEEAKCNNLKQKVFPKLYRKSLVEFEKSDSNMVRSVAVYYSNGVMGKKKYRSTYKASSFKVNNQTTSHSPRSKASRLTVAGCPIPKLVPYHRLNSFISDINIGTLYSVWDTLCWDLDEREKVAGVYRNLEELVINLASFYLNNNYDILSFGNPDTFHVALGGDGAPCGKDDTAVAWLVSILNIGQGVLSSSENFLLFGANCDESCVPVRRFVLQLMKDIDRIEKTTFPISCNNGNVRQIKFLFSEFPNDMKMLCFLTGELSNSATYFSSFADVSTESLKSKTALTGTFGPETSNQWKPWKYDHRVKVAAAVEKLKSKVSKEKITETTKRSKITAFISQQGSRQEFIPIIGKRVDRIHVDPLHLKNNACAYACNELLNQCSKNVSGVSSFSKLPSHSKLVRYVETLRTKCNLPRVAKKVIKWFEDSKNSQKDKFDYRFTGKDSRMFLHNFMFLFEIIEEGSDGQHYQQRLYALVLICLCLRDAVSLFCRTDITGDQVSKLKDLCSIYYRAYYVFYSVNPTVWTLGHVVASHTEDMLMKYGVGLALNSMEGREAKHISIAKFSQNTFFQNRWQQIFRHEYVSLIWLRERGFNLSSNYQSKLSYIPKRAALPSFFNCGFSKEENDEKCRFCCHPLMDKVNVSMEKGKWVN